jgi:20S proteasome alpha/beta subunit
MIPKPPYHSSQSKPQRLPKEATVTIAIGLSCNEGIVIAADSQETVSGYIKSHRGKVHTIIFPGFTVLAFAGSGQSDYIDTAIEKAIDGLHDLKTIPEIQQALEENLLGFFDKHLARWAYFPENERPTVELLIGVSTAKGAFGLFHYGGTSFHRIDRKAIGVGVLLADSLISQYSSESVEELSSIAVYILSKVKKQVDTCGGFTDLVALRKGGDFALTNSSETEELEKELETLERESIKELKAGILARKPHLSWLSEVRKFKRSASQK